MSQQLISRSPDLKRLRDEGYELDIKFNHLLVLGVPYVNSRGEIKRGTLISELTLAGDQTTRPSTHVVMFMGEHPCRKDGSEIVQIKHASPNQQLGPDLVANHSFSNKPKDGYGDYYEKMTRYVEIISSHAQSLDSDVTARTHRPIPAEDANSPFVYLDTATSRAGIGHHARKLESRRVAIVGLGGTGSYVLDLVAKTPVAEIHIYDKDHFLQHNAFRSPGAASLDALRSAPSKVSYFSSVYSNMHKGVVAHPYHIDRSNITELADMSFVFVCIDKGPTRQLIVEGLLACEVPFIDTGMGIELVEDHLIGILRVTTGTPTKKNHLEKRLSFSSAHDDEYAQNIQIADLNALSAALAVVKWKKQCGFYQDLEREHHSTYSLNVNLLTSDDRDGA